MRILHVTNTFLPVRNGVTVSVDGWVRALAQAGHDVAVWTVAREASARDGVFSSPGAVEIAAGFPLPLTTVPPKEVRAARWDVIHAHHPVLLGPAARQLVRAGGAVFAATVHSDYVAYVDAYAPAIAIIARPVVRLRMKRFFDSADVVFVPSPGIAAAVGSWGVETPLTPTSYPVDRAAFGRCSRAEARTRLGIGASTPLALYAGRFAADKRVERLISEFERVLPDLPDAVLALAGEGPHLARVRERASRLSGSVMFTGELEPERLGLWYAAADVFVSASPNEVGPLALIEAGLCGTAAIGLDVPGLRDRIIAERTGLLASETAGELGRRIAELLSDPHRAHAMGRAAAQHLAHHTPSEAAGSLVAAYQGAIERAPGRAPVRSRRGYRPGTERS